LIGTTRGRERIADDRTLAVVRETQNRAGLGIRSIVRQLRPLRSATIAINGTEQTFPPQISPDQQAILDAIHRPKLRH
jgi:hypothetical protein